MAVTHVLYEADGWGTGELVVEEERVVWHELPRPRAPRPATDSSLDPSRTPARPGLGPRIARKSSRRGGEFVAEVVRILQRHFARGAAAELAAVPVDLEYETEFLGGCARALRAVAPGETVTYGELAALAGAPGAARAAGSFCARNRLGLFVPCHRVVGVGGLGSYGSYGVGYKRRLLELEGWTP